jgi:hypothetical protein
MKDCRSRKLFEVMKFVKLAATRTWCWPLLAAALIGSGGCTEGPPLGEVTGRLTYKGQPVRYAAVELQPIGEGKGSLGWTDEDGEYVAQYTLSHSGALIGRHRIHVRVYPGEGEKPIPVPEKYGSNSRAELEVKEGSNRLDIELSAT